MITLPSEISPTSGVAATTGSSSATASANDSDQGFSALFNSKVNDQQQQTSTGTTGDKTAANANGSASVSTGTQTAAANGAPQTSTWAQRRAAELAALDAQEADTQSTPQLPATGDTDADSTTGTTSATTPQKDADPALDNDAAQALMALLAQTNPVTPPIAATQPAGAGETEGTADNGLSLISGVAANMAAGAVSMVAGAAANTVVGAAVNTVADAAANLFAADKTTPDTVAANQNQTPTTVGNAGTAAQATAAKDQAAAKSTDATKTLTNADTAALTTADLPPELKKSTTALALGQPDNNGSSAVTEAKDGTTRTDSDTPLTTASPVPQLTTSLSQSDVGQQDTTLLLKKTGDVSMGSPSSQTATASLPISTLSADDTSATTTPSSALISAQLGSDEWQQAIGQQVVMYSRDGQQTAELRLHPDNLGSVQISMQVDTNNLMQIHMVSGHSQVRAALEDALPNLRDSLAQSGINLGQSSVGSDATPNWNGSGQNSAAGGQTGETFSVNATAGNADNIKVQAPSTTTGRAAGIDTFA